MKTKSKNKNKQGISLIVLVITIIVMIILAAAIILSLTSNGIIDRANEAVDKTDEAQVKAYAQTLWADAYLDGKRGVDLIEAVETELEELGVTPMNYTLDISDSGMDIQKFDIANWEFAYTYDQEGEKWSDKILATANSNPEGDIVAKFYNLGREVIPDNFEFNGIYCEFKPGNAYKMVIQGSGDMGNLMITDERNKIISASGWQLETAMFVEKYTNTCMIPYVTEIVIDEGVTNIGECAFLGAACLKKVELSNDITRIGDRAFTLAKSLQSITIPNNVISIGEYAFQKCENLNNIVIPKGVTNISSGTFSGCENLTSLSLPKNIISINYAAFYECSNLKNITIPNNVTSIEDVTFADCINLTSIIIPESVLSIGVQAFRTCTSLTTVYYTGTEEQWNKITIDYSNELLTNANIIFEYTPNN